MEFYRDNRTGDIGSKVESGGRTYFQLDRPNEEIRKPFNESQHILDNAHRPLNGFQVAQIAFEADKQLCLCLGIHDKARRDWHGLEQEQRLGWRDEGPEHPIARVKLYRSIMKAMSHLTGK